MEGVHTAPSTTDEGWGTYSLLPYKEAGNVPPSLGSLGMNDEYEMPVNDKTTSMVGGVLKLIALNIKR